MGYRSELTASILVFLALAANTRDATAASFDCTKASNVVERLICSDTSLSQLDDRMAAAFSAARSQSTNLQQLVSEQRNWITQRNACQTASCVTDAFHRRLATLDARVAETPNLAPANRASVIPANSCDTAAAYQFDNQRVAPGVSYGAINAPNAVAQCAAAAKRYPDSGRMQFQLGRALEKSGNLPDAITAYQRAADLGHGGGFNNIGELYRDGKGFSRDLTKAEQYFERGAALAAARS